MTRPKKEKYCRWCELTKPMTQFDNYPSPKGRMVRASFCQGCSNPDTPKRCKDCMQVLPAEVFWVANKDYMRGGYWRRICAQCVWVQRTQPPSWQPRGLSRAARHDLRESQRMETPKPPGWTPPPSADEMARWYASIQASSGARRLRNLIPAGE